MAQFVCRGIAVPKYVVCPVRRQYDHGSRKGESGECVNTGDFALSHRDKYSHDSMAFNEAHQMRDWALTEVPCCTERTSCCSRFGREMSGFDFAAYEPWKVNFRKSDCFLNGVDKFPELFGIRNGLSALFCGGSAKASEESLAGLEFRLRATCDEELAWHIKRHCQRTNELWTDAAGSRFVLTDSSW